MKLLLTNLNARCCQVLRVSSIFCALALRPHHDPETDIPDPVLKPENQETGLEKSAELAEANETDNTDNTDKTMATNATNATNAINATNGTNGAQTEQHPNLADMPMPSLIVAWLMSRQSWSDRLQFTVEMGPQTGS